MNWDISVGQCKQWYGRALQEIGRRLGHGRFVVDGERHESGGRLQARYGLLKHRVQWGDGLVRIPVDRRVSDRARKR